MRYSERQGHTGRLSSRSLVPSASAFRECVLIENSQEVLQDLNARERKSDSHDRLPVVSWLATQPSRNYGSTRTQWRQENRERRRGGLERVEGLELVAVARNE
jgi:hypothetical protein